MVKGLDLFSEHFKGHLDSFLLIGGVACEQWLALRGRPFRITRDMDVVLVVEALSPAFIKHFWSFIQNGHYRRRQKSEMRKEHYRFSRPETPDFPAMIELFSRRLDTIALDAGQHLTPIPMDVDLSSLSAILMEDAYYNLALETRITVGNLPIVKAEGLIPLKARAWRDLHGRLQRHEPVDKNDVLKHRNDIFRLTLALTNEPFRLCDSIRADLQSFVNTFPATAPEWGGIMAALQHDGAVEIEPAEILETLVRHFGLAMPEIGKRGEP